MSPNSTTLPSAEDVLEEFYDRFLKEVDPNAVVNVLQRKGIIPQGDQAEMSRTEGDSPFARQTAHSQGKQTIHWEMAHSQGI